MSAEIAEVITNSHAADMPAKRLLMHANEEHAGDLVDPETRAQWDRAAEVAHRAWVDSLAQRACDKAAKDLHAVGGSALLLWVEPDGSLNARRISREESMVREFVPDYLRRRGAR